MRGVRIPGGQRNGAGGAVYVGVLVLKNGSGRGGDNMEASVCLVTRETVMAGSQGGVTVPSGRGGGHEGHAKQEAAVMIGRPSHQGSQKVEQQVNTLRITEASFSPSQK